jgi:threonyl-tRNA synthetase
MLVVGDREAREGTVSVRNRRHGDLGSRSLEQFITEAKELIERKAPTE